MRLTVAQALPALHQGGVERGTTDLAIALHRAGHRSIVLSAGGRLAEALHEQGVETPTWSIGRKHPAVLLQIPKLRRYLLRERIDILHARSRLPAWICELTLRTLPPHRRPRYLTTVHGRYSVNRYSAVMARGERVIAVSDFIRDYLREHYRAQAVVTIHNGVDPEQYPRGHLPPEPWLQQWYQRYPQLQSQAFTITLPARFSPRKGHEDLIRILAALRSSKANAYAIITGDPSHRPRHHRAIMQQARAQGVHQALLFPGTKDTKHIMAISSAILTISKQPEAFGRATLEALYLGKPVIAYHHGGTKEIMQAIFPWGAVPPGDWRAAADKLQQINTNQNQHRPNPKTPYTTKKNHAQTIALYQELAQERQAAPQ